MELIFTIDGKSPDPQLGIVEGYIQEGINQVSLIELDVVTEIFLEEADCEALIGKTAMVSLGDLVAGELQWARFDGIVYEVHASDSLKVERGQFLYKLIVRPPLWKLNFTRNSKSFPEKSRIDVIDEVLEAGGINKGIAYDKFYQSADVYRKLHQVLQTEESDLKFVQRLMQEGGINYFHTANSNGDEPEILKLVDNGAYFGKRWDSAVTWTPDTGQTPTERYVGSFQSHFHTTPSSVGATVNLGDGIAKAFPTARPVSVAGGQGGSYNLLGREGTDAKDANQPATVVAQGLEAHRVTYEGESNVFLIRPGERVPVQRRFDGVEEGAPKFTLVTSVRHRFRQSPTVALGSAWDPEYRNSFAAVRDDVELRPLQLGSSQLTEALSSRRDTASAQVFDQLSTSLKDALNVDVDLDTGFAEGPQFDVSQIMLAVVEQLTRSASATGVMVGVVTEDATVINNNELTCKIKSEHFPEEITAKVALGWLTNKGWLSLLPRKDMQVYFMLVQGDGGQNEAVILGYRPTNLVKALDPSKTSETKKLVAGDPPELAAAATSVVKPEIYEPSNRQRNTLLGADGVAEVAVIDGGEDSVAIHANKGVHIVGDVELHLDGASQLHKADTVSQQYGEVLRGVAGDQKESIGGKHEATVMGDQELHVAGKRTDHVVGGITLHNDGEEDIVIANGDDAALTLAGGATATLAADGANFIAISKDDTKISVTADDEVSITTPDSTAVLNPDGVTLDAGGNTVTISSGGDIEVKGSGNITVSGMMISIQDATNIDIKANAQVNVTGAMVNIN